MTPTPLAWGITAFVLCYALGLMSGWPIGHRRGWRGCEEAAEEARQQTAGAKWTELADEPARPAPPWPPAPPEVPHAGPGKHRQTPGPRHAALPVAGRMTVPEPNPWARTITLPAPAQAPPWEAPPPEPEPQTEVLEPTAVLAPDSCTESAWTRRMAADMDKWLAEHIGATDSVLKEITR